MDCTTYVINVKGVIIMKDYNKMRCAISYHEAETREPSDIYEILLFGIEGYNDMKDKDILEIFVHYWGEEQIPYK